MSITIFLGAGASKADGAPLQNELFKEYFRMIRKKDKCNDIENESKLFFKFMFNIDVDIDDLDNIIFPTFEEALGIADLAELREETFKEYNLQNARSCLVLLMAKAIKDKLEASGGKYHKLLVDNLNKHNLLKDIIFISTNYDILIDNALGLFDIHWCSVNAQGSH
jgi:hypothetical protein